MRTRNFTYLARGPCLKNKHHKKTTNRGNSQTARFMGPTWGPLGDDRTQVGLVLAPWTLLSGNPQLKRHSVNWVYAYVSELKNWMNDINGCIKFVIVNVIIYSWRHILQVVALCILYNKNVSVRPLQWATIIGMKSTRNLSFDFDYEHSRLQSMVWANT